MTDARQTHRGVEVDKAVEQMPEFCDWAWRKWAALSSHFDDSEDLKHQILCHWLDKKFLPRYNPEVTSVRYFLCMGVRNWVINYLTRKRHKMVNPTVTSEDGDEIQIIEMIRDAKSESKNAITRFLVDELLLLMDGKERGKVCLNERNGEETRLSERNVMRFYLSQYKRKEIAQIYGVTPGNIARIVKIGLGKIHENWASMSA